MRYELRYFDSKRINRKPHHRRQKDRVLQRCHDDIARSEMTAVSEDFQHRHGSGRIEGNLKDKGWDDGGSVVKHCDSDRHAEISDVVVTRRHRADHSIGAALFEHRRHKDPVKRRRAKRRQCRDTKRRTEDARRIRRRERVREHARHRNPEHDHIQGKRCPLIDDLTAPKQPANNDQYCDGTKAGEYFGESGHKCIF